MKKVKGDKKQEFWRGILSQKLATVRSEEQLLTGEAQLLKDKVASGEAAVEKAELELKEHSEMARRRC